MVKIIPILAVIILSSFPAYAGDEGGFVFRTDPEIKRVAPKKPVTIKLKRLKDGTYTWELRGDDADEILDADRKLRKRLGAK